MQRGGKKAPLGDEEPVSGKAERGVMMEASPAPAFKVAQTEFLFEFLVVAFHDPTLLGDSHQLFELALSGQVRQPVFGGLGRSLGPLDQQPLLRIGLALPVVPMGGPDPRRREPRAKMFLAAGTPSDLLPRRLR